MSASDIQARLLAFLAGELALRKDESCVKIELEYSPGSGYRADQIKSWTPTSAPEAFGILPIEEGESDDPKEREEKSFQRRHVFTQRLVAEIISLAEDFADSYDQGTHRFTVRTIQHFGGRATHRFKIQPSFRGDSAGGEEAALEPTNAGVVSQLMRHLENRDRNQREMLGAFLQAIKHPIDTLRDENVSLREQNAQLLAARSEMMDKIEAARSTEHDRELELAIVMGERERKDFATKKVVNLLPVAMSAAIRRLGAGKDEAQGQAKKSAGVNGKKSAPSPLAEAIGKLAISFSDEQKSQLQTMLSMQQLLSLQEVIETSLDGGGILLPTLAQDLFTSIRPGQLKMMMDLFSDPQKAMLVQVFQLVNVSKDMAREADDPGDAKASEGEAGNDETKAQQPEA